MADKRSQAIILDAWRDPARDVRVAVDYWCSTVPISDQYVVRPRSIRMVWNYLRRVGPQAVLRKIRSRLGEERRNAKVAGIGYGVLLEAPATQESAVGERVIFFAPNHSTDWPRLSLDARLIRQVSGDSASSSGEKKVAFPESLQALSGWSPFSGLPLDAGLVQSELSRVTRLCPPPPDGISRSRQERAHERLAVNAGRTGKRTAVLFGLGNYAKTQILPHLRSHLQLTTVHEVDPDQMHSAVDLGAMLDTSPWPRNDERYDAWFVAGFHHMHASIAIRALESGAYAVVEKPLATTRDQYRALRETMERSPSSRLFAGFHKRYSRLNEWAREDLAIPLGERVDMHGIVYEIPLPARHWYNWPNSGSRLISNGCHWLDYFLYVNDNSPVSERYVRRMRGSDLLVAVRLENGAELTLSLTDTGSERLGVRDVIELRAKNATVRLVDSTEYEGENSTRMLRRARVNPMDAYARMYDSICRRIASGQAADARESLRSTALMLDLEEDLVGAGGSTNG
jgi:predicted dehydrogenase